MSEAHQDMGAVWDIHESAERNEEVSMNALSDVHQTESVFFSYVSFYCIIDLTALTLLRTKPLKLNLFHN